MKNLSGEKKIIDLLKWMKTRGYKTSKHLVPAMFPDTGRGMMVKKSILSGDHLISIPLPLLITTSVAMESYLGQYITRWTRKLTPRQILVAFLICEKHRDWQSPWKPYLETLPISYSLPCCWETIPIDLPKHMRDCFTQQVEDVKRDYNCVNPFVDWLAKETGIAFSRTYESFVWGWCTIQTRGVHYEQSADDNYALAPFLDLLNHSPNAKVTAGVNVKKNCYEIITHKPFSKGQQVFINYGDLSNLQLILNYGFYVNQNPHSSVIFELGEIICVLDQLDFDRKVTSNLNKKMELLRNHELIKDLFCDCDGISWNFQVCLRILTCEYLELKNWYGALTGPLNDDNEIRMKKMVQHCLEVKFCERTEQLQRRKWENSFCLWLLEEERDILKSCITTHVTN